VLLNYSFTEYWRHDLEVCHPRCVTNTGKVCTLSYWSSNTTSFSVWSYYRIMYISFTTVETNIYYSAIRPHRKTSCVWRSVQQSTHLSCWRHEFAKFKRNELGRFSLHSAKLQCRPNHRHLWLFPNSIQFEHVMNVRNFLRYSLIDLIIKAGLWFVSWKRDTSWFLLTTNIFRESLPPPINIINSKNTPSVPYKPSALYSTGCPKKIVPFFYFFF
jgi:hypothetical protein